VAASVGRSSVNASWLSDIGGWSPSTGSWAAVARGIFRCHRGASLRQRPESSTPFHMPLVCVRPASGQRYCKPSCTAQASAFLSVQSSTSTNSTFRFSVGCGPTTHSSRRLRRGLTQALDRNGAKSPHHRHSHQPSALGADHRCDPFWLARHGWVEASGLSPERTLPPLPTLDASFSACPARIGRFIWSVWLCISAVPP